MTTPVESFEQAVGDIEKASSVSDYGSASATFDDASVGYRAFYEGAAVYDDGQRGKVRGVGADVLDLLNRLSTNSVDRLLVGEGAPTIFTSEKGRIIDLVYVLNLGDFVLLLTGSGAQGRVMDWVDRYTFMEDSTLEDVTDEMSLLTVEGPKAHDVLEAVTGMGLADMEAFHSRRFESQGLSGWVVRMDIRAHPGFWVVVEDAGKQALLEKLAAEGATLVGIEAWEAFRIEIGLPMYGNELDEGRNPLEAGLIGAIDFAKGCYIGQEVIARLDTYKKVQRALVSLKVVGVWEEGDAFELDGRRVGTIPSVAQVPGGGDGVGLGYVRVAGGTVGQRFEGEGAEERWVEVIDVPKLFGD